MVADVFVKVSKDTFCVTNSCTNVISLQLITASFFGRIGVHVVGYSKISLFAYSAIHVFEVIRGGSKVRSSDECNTCK